MKKRVLLTLCVSIAMQSLMGAQPALEVAGNAENVSIQGPFSKEQAVKKLLSEERPQELSGNDISRFKRMAQFLTKKKDCLIGVGCSDRMSLMMNYLLGVAAIIGPFLARYTAKKVIRSGVIPQNIDPDETSIDLTKAAREADFLITGIINTVIPYQYKQKYLQFVNNPEPLSDTSFKAWRSCLVSGMGCTMDQRRLLFFMAGVNSVVLARVSIAGYYIINGLIQRYLLLDKEIKNIQF